MDNNEKAFREMIMANLLASGCPNDKAEEIINHAMKLSDDVSTEINTFCESDIDVSVSNSALRIFILVMRHRFNLMEHEDLMVNYGGAVIQSDSIN